LIYCYDLENIKKSMKDEKIAKWWYTWNYDDNPIVILGLKLGIIDLNLLVPSGIIASFKIL
jgi:hypothetical protein